MKLLRNLALTPVAVLFDVWNSITGASALAESHRRATVRDS